MTNRGAIYRADAVVGGGEEDGAYLVTPLNCVLDEGKEEEEKGEAPLKVSLWRVEGE